MYNKQDAVMTHGFAILCMLVLHLFCRTGSDVFGTPLIWLDSETPFVYLFGFYAEICVSIYSICMGYAQYLLYSCGKSTWQSTGKRILKLMMNYWILLAMFSIIGLIHSSQKAIPGSLASFLKSIVLLHSYNGAWWFLNTYIVFLLIPPAVRFFPVTRLSVRRGLVFCFVFQVGWYLLCKFGFWPVVSGDKPIIAFIFNELYNFIGILPSVWVGACFCKGKIITQIHNLFFDKLRNRAIRNIILGCIWMILFISMNLIHKAVLNTVFAAFSFLLFNIWEKGTVAERIWLFLGKHSTNIWLTHMFFYATLFPDLVQKTKYPLLMLGYLLVLCIVVSYVEMIIERFIYSFKNQ